MTLTIKNAALAIAISAGLSACDSVQITGGPLAIGAAQAGNLLDNGTFDRDFGDWRACSNPQLVSLKTNDTRTEGSAVLGAGGCLYQMVPAQVNDNMIVNCSASKADVRSLASLTFGYLDEDFQPLKTVDAEIPDVTPNNVSAVLRAPAGTAYAEVLIYAEDGAEIDDCELINTQQGASPEWLINSHFEEQLDGWQPCSHGTVTASNGVATINNSCISQKFTASEGLQLKMTCDAYKKDTEYAALALGYLDEDFLGIELVEQQLTEQEDSTASLELTGPATTVFVEAMIYGSGEININNCSLQKLEQNN